MFIHEARVENPSQPLLGVLIVWLGATRPLLVEFHLRVRVPCAFFAVRIIFNVNRSFSVFVNDGAPTAGTTHVSTVCMRRLRTFLSSLYAPLPVVPAIPTIPRRHRRHREKP